MVSIKVKWNKLTFDNVVLDPSTQTVLDFKRHLQTLTNVPIERQKLMGKGAWDGILKDDVDLKACKITEGLTVLLMGTADQVAPPPPPAAIEMKEDGFAEESEAPVQYPAGLVNTGNTCYLNSVVQSLRYVPQFNEILQQSSSQSRLLNLLYQLYSNLSASKTAVGPFLFIQELRQRYPQFGEQRNGRFAQQDADELFNCLLAEIPQFQTGFTVQLDVSYTCTESSEEPVVHQTEMLNKLTCNIMGGTDKHHIDNIFEGLKLGLECTIEKQSSILQKENALWSKKQRIAVLPPCLCIHFVRFFWKTVVSTNPSNPGPGGLKCKILRQVNFPETLDVYEYCSEALQAQLQVTRAALRTASESGSSEKVEGMSGKYRLFSIVAHKGRDADSGHYISIVRDTKVENRWWKFDDAVVSQINTEEVLSLRGGGDKEMVYLAFYTAI
eukprot:gene12411-13571_t